MNEFLMVLIAVFWGWICCYFAGQRGRNQYGWFFLGLLFGPFPLVALFLMPVIEEAPPSLTEIPEVHVAHHPPFDHFDWYHLDENRQPVGPINFDTLQQLWGERKINEHSLIWNDTMENWKKVRDVSELKEKLSKKTVKP